MERIRGAVVSTAGAAVVCMLMGLSISSCSWRMTTLVLAKGIAASNCAALLGLFVQRRGYGRLLGAPEQNVLFMASFVACLLLFFGVLETASAAFLAWSFRRIASPLRPFTGLQMFSQLPEATAVFALGSLFSVLGSDLPVVVLQQALLLRLMLGGGLGKLRGNWLAGTAMDHYYWTTPLPNIVSPLMHSLPGWLHRLECRATLLVEGWPTAVAQLVPWQPARSFACFCYIGLLCAINATGCYGHLGLLSIVQCLSLLDDWTLSFVVRRSFLERFSLWTYAAPQPLFLVFGEYSGAVVGAVGCIAVSFYVAASLVPFRECYHFPFPDPEWKFVLRLYNAVAPFFVLGKYVKFGSVTTTRFEIILQVAGEDGEFHDWPTLYKPCSVDARPPLAVWLMPGVDWQLWFVGLHPFERPEWLDRLMILLLKGDPDVLRLVGPCPVERAAEIRAAVFDYRYAGDPAGKDFDERGTIWARKFVRFLGRPIRKKVLTSQ